MGRTLSSTTQIEIAKAITRPFYCIYLGFSTPLRLTTHGSSISWDSQTWLPSDGPVPTVSITQARDGMLVGALSLPNYDLSLSAIILSEGCAGKSCQIYKLYGAGPYASADGTEIFSGVMDAATGIDLDTVTIDLRGESFNDNYTPHILCNPPTFNHLPAQKVIVWGNETYVLTHKYG